METSLTSEQIRAYAEREADLNGLVTSEDRELFVDFLVHIGELVEAKRQQKEKERRADNG